MPANSARERGNDLGPTRWTGCALVAVVAVCWTTGCASTPTTPRVIYLEGSSWFTSSGSVRSGLRSAGYQGAFETFTWTSYLGFGADHFVAARSTPRARRLARRIADIRRENPEGQIHLMALSAGTGVAVKALEELPEDVAVDHVVLLSSSLSERRDLGEALRHVRGTLYATCSERDGILASLAINADGRVGPAAGQRGFRLPKGLTREQKRRYAKVVNLPWQPSYVGFGWNGGHVRVTKPRFVAAVIAPRIMSAEPFPLDRPMVVLVPRDDDPEQVNDGFPVPTRESGRPTSPGKAREPAGGE